MRNFLIVFSVSLITLVSVHAQSSHGSDDSSMANNETSTFIDDIIRIKADINSFYLNCENWDDGSIKGKLDEIEALHKQIEKLAPSLNSRNKESEKEFWDIYNSCVRIYNEVEFAKSVLTARVEKEKEWETNYFRLWEQILEKKETVNNLYIEKKVNSGSKSIGYDRENTVIRKRRLYYSWNEVYEAFLKDMKRTQQYENRIDIENNIMDLFEKVEDLAFASTRELEKSLKSTDDPNDKFQLIISFQPKN